MKAKLAIVAALLFSLTNAFSQDYHPLLNNTSWAISDWVACCRPPEYRMIEQGTDVTIGFNTYKQFVDPFASSTETSLVNLREDVNEQKVYKLVNGTDVLLYDFSLENGDLISMYGYTFKATVDEVTVINDTRKRITLNSLKQLNESFTLKQIWIEGVGSTAHPFYPDYNMFAVASSNGGYQMRNKCVFQNGEHIYGTSNYCDSVQLSVTAPETVSNKISFLPNPFVTELTITSGILLQNATFEMYNMQGQLVKVLPNINGEKVSINRDNLTSGIYFAQLSENGKLLKTEKILVN